MINIAYSITGKVFTLCAIDEDAAKELVPVGAILADTHICRDDPDGLFFNAWQIVGGSLVLDLKKAASLRLEQIRERRNERLKELDTDQIIALGRGDGVKVSAVEAQKQKLRDLPASLDFSSAKNAYDLQHVFPPIIV